MAGFLGGFNSTVNTLMNFDRMDMAKAKEQRAQIEADRQDYAARMVDWQNQLRHEDGSAMSGAEALQLRPEIMKEMINHPYYRNQSKYNHETLGVVQMEDGSYSVALKTKNGVRPLTENRTQDPNDPAYANDHVRLYTEEQMGKVAQRLMDRTFANQTAFEHAARVGNSSAPAQADPALSLTQPAAPQPRVITNEEVFDAPWEDAATPAEYEAKATGLGEPAAPQPRVITNEEVFDAPWEDAATPAEYEAKATGLGEIASPDEQAPVKQALGNITTPVEQVPAKQRSGEKTGVEEPITQGLRPDELGDLGPKVPKNVRLDDEKDRNTMLRRAREGMRHVRTTLAKKGVASYKPEYTETINKFAKEIAAASNGSVQFKEGDFVWVQDAVRVEPKGYTPSEDIEAELSRTGENTKGLAGLGQGIAGAAKFVADTGRAFGAATAKPGTASPDIDGDLAQAGDNKKGLVGLGQGVAGAVKFAGKTAEAFGVAASGAADTVGGWVDEFKAGYNGAMGTDRATDEQPAPETPEAPKEIQTALPKGAAAPEKQAAAQADKLVQQYSERPPSPKQQKVAIDSAVKDANPRSVARAAAMFYSSGIMSGAQAASWMQAQLKLPLEQKKLIAEQARANLDASKKAHEMHLKELDEHRKASGESVSQVQALFKPATLSAMGAAGISLTPGKDGDGEDAVNKTRVGVTYGQHLGDMATNVAMSYPSEMKQRYNVDMRAIQAKGGVLSASDKLGLLRFYGDYVKHVATSTRGDTGFLGLSSKPPVVKDGSMPNTPTTTFGGGNSVYSIGDLRRVLAAANPGKEISDAAVFQYAAQQGLTPNK